MPGKIFRDPVCEYITVSDQELRLIDSAWFQRLRHCSQNGPARLVYPSLLGTRFEHSLGVMELGDRVLRSALDKEKHYDPPVIGRFLKQCQRDFKVFLGRTVAAKNVEQDLIRILRMACLCHDLGHFPLSHTFERAFEQKFWSDAIPQYWMNIRACHEAVSAEILRQVAYEHAPDLIEPWLARAAILVLLSPPDVQATQGRTKIPLRSSVFNALSSILIGDYDVDRLDYLQRDGRMSGAGFGQIDLERLVKSMMLVEWDGRFEVMPTSRALSTVEAMLLERYKEFKWVVFHHKVVFFNEITVEVARDILAADGSGFFRWWSDDVPTADSYRDEVLSALATPDVKLPPLNLYRGDKLGMEPGAYVLNGQFFVNNDDSHLLDDSWFALKCRSLCKAEPDEGKFYLQALVDRRKCGLTLWKDLAQFQRFHSLCFDEAIACKPLKELANRDALDRFPTEANEWLKRLWASMREEEKFGEKTCEVLGVAVRDEIREASDAAVKGLVALIKWSKLFGRLASKHVLGRRGNPVSLLANSNLLSRLAGLEGEIPFFVFMLGEEEQLRQLLVDITEDAEDAEDAEDYLLQKAARGFIKGIVSCWEQKETPEPRRAWLEVALPD